VSFSQGARKTGAETACLPAEPAVFSPKSDICPPSLLFKFFLHRRFQVGGQTFKTMSKSAVP
jgi:hypothetical protein